MASKKSTYKPEAIDADGDGIVQEGTEFERPVSSDLPEECCMQDCGECTFSLASEGTSETTTPPVETNVYVAKDGDTYASLAAQFSPAGVKKHDYAVTLHQLNRGARLSAGVEVKLA